MWRAGGSDARSLEVGRPDLVDARGVQLSGRVVEEGDLDEVDARVVAGDPMAGRVDEDEGRIGERLGDLLGRCRRGDRVVRTGEDEGGDLRRDGRIELAGRGWPVDRTRSERAARSPSRPGSLNAAASAAAVSRAALSAQSTARVIASAAPVANGTPRWMIVGMIAVSPASSASMIEGSSGISEAS